jgi:aspartate 1-decarboxylase
MLKSKIHRAAVTDSALHYEGILTLDETLMKEADIFPFEHIYVYNITNSHWFETYVMRGEKGSGIICVNGAAAHLAEREI